MNLIETERCEALMKNIHLFFTPDFVFDKTLSPWIFFKKIVCKKIYTGK